MSALASALLLLSASAETAPTVSRVAEVNDIVRAVPVERDRHVNRPFDLTGTAVNASIDLILSDDSGSTYLLGKLIPEKLVPITPGDVVRVSGRFEIHRSGRLVPICRDLRFLRHGPAIDYPAASGSDFISGRFDYRSLSLTGTVLDAIVDEIDPKFTYLILDCDGFRIPCPTSRCPPDALLGHRVEVRGICNLAPLSARRLIGRVMHALRIRDLGPGPADPFDVPELTGCRFLQPREISSLGRRRLQGHVLAVWKQEILVTTDDNLVARIEHVENAGPRCGDRIEASGLPETDVYMPILRRAKWRKLDVAPMTPPPPADVPFKSIFIDEYGTRRANSAMHGKPIRTVAKVRGLPSASGPVNYMTIGTDDLSIPVDISSATPRPDGLTVGCTVEITGIYLLECQAWRPNASLPPITGVRIIVRSPADVRVVSRPPWWTPARLFSVIAVLAAVLVCILVWNLSLRRLAQKRGIRLSEERIARAEAEIKTLERTRLAVELHDTIAQNLTGVSIAIDTARQLGGNAPPELLRQIDVAGATLDSCQVELRNCLWDLRNLALEQSDFNTAIRTALAPHVNSARLDVRFNVPRSRLVDSTAHALLRIIRELVINSVRHGHATRIWIAGALEPDALQFSVRDNGCGFAVDNCPGIAEKHFGLQGIRERLLHLGGEFRLESTPGKGTKATVVIRL